MRFGVCYYPEHWPPERWTTDARLMRESGITIVRIAEFAWSLMEPEEGTYNWTWLDNAITTLANEGLQVMLGTPTATPPAWLTRTHPDILRVDKSTIQRNHGSRRHYCPNSPTYRLYSRRIVTAMAERYGQDKRITVWQIDNEFGGGRTARCYCSDCAQAFRLWLQQRYQTIDNLNDSWGNIFWSQIYQDWSQIEPPSDDIDKKNPSHELDYFRFASDSMVAYQQEQFDIIRQLAPNRRITTNLMGLYLDLDQFDLATPLDYVTWDNYPTGNPDRWRQLMYPPGRDTSANPPIYSYDVGDPMIQGMAHALTYGLKNAPFGIMEQQCGHINWGDVNPGIRPEIIRLWVWQAVAEGAEELLFFRWRATLFAHEQYHSGLLGHDARPQAGFAAFQTLQAEYDQLAQIVAQPVTADVALIFNYDDLWALQLQPHRRDFHYLRHLFLYYEALRQDGTSVTIVSPDADLSPFKLVIAPSAHLATAELSQKFQTYVETGGTLVFGVRSGFKTDSNLVTDTPLPGHLHHLVGATVTHWQTLPNGIEWPLAESTTNQDTLHMSGSASYWVEHLDPTSATSLLQYQSGETAITVNEVGQGHVYYVGFYPTPDQAHHLITHWLDTLNAPYIGTLPPGIFYYKRGPYHLFLNFTDNEHTILLPEAKMTVPPRDILITKE
ncbi:MAG TPA: beta-galactosidase [Anaerolineae bacterium]|nr:beta-galactosidase [Anaerolineae bacterium]